MPLVLFAFLAALAIIASLGVILQRNLIHCVLALALVLVDIGVLFMGLGAVTVGFLQIIVYVGAIMVLFLFVIWLLNVQADVGTAGASLALKLFGSIGAAALAAELFAIFSRVPSLREIRTVPADFGSIARLAHALFGNYLVAFEVTSILLLAAIVGAIALARKLSVPAEIALANVVGGAAAPRASGQPAGLQAGRRVA